MLIKTICTLSVTLCTLSLLTACIPMPPPMQFGMEQSQFQQLTKDQQDQVIAGYNQRQQTDADNAVYNNAINSATSILAMKQKPVNTFPAAPPAPPAPSHYFPEASAPLDIPASPVMPNFPAAIVMPSIGGDINSSHSSSTTKTTSTDIKSVSNTVGIQGGF